jgi:hypothetical protein
MSKELLNRAVEAFNTRRYDAASALLAEGLADVVGREELFWLGLRDAADGYALVVARKLAPAEAKMVAAMEKLRHFGFRHEDLEVTSVLAGLRRGVEEIRMVQAGQKPFFDATLLPQIRQAARADNR